MDAIRIALWVGELLRRELVPLLLVDGGVGVLSVIRELSDIQNRHWHLRSAEQFAY